jgi:hypothetical protein
MEKCIDKRGMAYLNHIFEEIANTLGYQIIDDSIVFMRVLLKELGLNNPQSEKYEEDVITLSQSVNQIRLKNNPVILEMSAIKKIYGDVVIKYRKER